MDPKRNHPPKKPDGKRPKGSIWMSIIVSIAIILIISSIYNAVTNSQFTQTTFSDFMTEAKNDNLAKKEIIWFE